MGFKLRKLNLDLELDLTEYIPGEAGLINPTKTTPEDLFQWVKFCGKKAKELDDYGKSDKGMKDPESAIDLTREILIEQVDYLYGKGVGYYKAIPFQLLKEILGYIREQVSAVEKKRGGSRK